MVFSVELNGASQGVEAEKRVCSWSKKQVLELLCLFYYYYCCCRCAVFEKYMQSGLMELQYYSLYARSYLVLMLSDTCDFLKPISGIR